MEKNKETNQQIDAANQAIGRLATKIAIILRGKDQPEYNPRLDSGAAVEVINIAKVKITGNKLEQKTYYSHSGYPGGLKTKTMKDVFAKNPAEVLRRAVWNMLPKNKLRQEMIKRLHIS